MGPRSPLETGCHAPGKMCGTRGPSCPTAELALQVPREPPECQTRLRGRGLVGASCLALDSPQGDAIIHSFGQMVTMTTHYHVVPATKDCGYQAMVPAFGYTTSWGGG